MYQNETVITAKDLETFKHLERISKSNYFKNIKLSNDNRGRRFFIVRILSPIINSFCFSN